MRKTGLILICVLFLLGIIHTASALTNASAVQQAGVNQNITGNLSSGFFAPVTAMGGNVSQISLNKTISTIKWQGFFGKVNASIALGLGDDIFYMFADGNATVEVICAARDPNFAFGNITIVPPESIDHVWRFNNSDSDNATVIMNSEKNKTIGGLPEVAYVRTPSTDNATVPGWETGIFGDGSVNRTTNETLLYVEDAGLKKDYAFCVDTNSTQNFQAETDDYQLMVPVQENSTTTGTALPNQGSEVYYFFMQAS